ncbi:hypothetical protein Gpo141_00006026 [Globisporangium polare]
MPNQITTKQQELNAQIQRLKMKAFTAAAAMPCAAADYSYNGASDSESAGPPPSSHPRLKRRLRSSGDLCECGSDFQGATGEEGEEDEFTGPDGSFKLPRLMHPALKRQHAVANIKHERREPVSVPARTTAMMLLSKPSRVLPCTLSRAMNLRFVQ